LAATLYEFGKSIQRPAAVNLPSILISKPERQPNADNRSDDRCDKQGPRLDFGGNRQTLIAIIKVEPGTTVPTTAMASDTARRSTAVKAKCGCAPTKSIKP
jgi:hypothetical protein